MDHCKKCELYVWHGGIFCVGRFFALLSWLHCKCINLSYSMGVARIIKLIGLSLPVGLRGMKYSMYSLIL